jgi:hypothetical protein
LLKKGSQGWNIPLFFQKKPPTRPFVLIFDI